MKPRILVVEDQIDNIEIIFKRPLSELDIEVDYAQSKLEAIEKIRCKTYNVAFVDIMLREDRRDRGGVEVIEYLDKLSEGTAIIVVSATDDIRVPISTFKLGIVDYIQKQNIYTKQAILDPLKRILENYNKHYKINYFGRFITLSAYLAYPELTPYWENRVLSTVKVGYQLMVDTLNNTLENYLPILREKKASYSLRTDENNQCVYGIFWSKSIGSPIWFSVANKNGKLIEPPEQSKGEILKNQKKGDIEYSIWKMIGIKRDDFNDSIWD